MLISEELEHCSRCGLCLSVCPTYRDTGLETYSPRGRVALMGAVTRGELSPRGNFRNLIYQCLDCRACETLCPSGVKVGHGVLAARAYLEYGRSQSALKALLLKRLLPFPSRLELSFWPLMLYQRLGLQSLIAHAGLLHLMPWHLDRLAELLLPLPSKPLRHTLDEVTPAKGVRRYRVGFLLGCAMSLLFARASRATVRVLTENGCEVVAPRQQKCCGAPHAAEGDIDTLKELARHNINTFEEMGIEAVVTDCAACGAMAKEYGDLLADDPLCADKARSFSHKVRDISEFLTQIPLDGCFGEVRCRVTYHEPCHLRHAQGVTREPRSLLKAIPGLALIEMKEADWCCGSAGTYNLTHYERSMRILDRKMDNMAATGAEVVATGNPGCLLQLNLGIKRKGLKVRVVHPIELLDKAYRMRQDEN